MAPVKGSRASRHRPFRRQSCESFLESRQKLFRGRVRRAESVDQKFRSKCLLVTCEEDLLELLFVPYLVATRSFLQYLLINKLLAKFGDTALAQPRHCLLY